MHAFLRRIHPENAARYEQKIADFGEIDICYEKDPKMPFLNSIVKINGDPFTYQRYAISAPTNALEKASNEILCKLHEQL